MKDSGMIFRPDIQKRLDSLSEERFIYVCAPAGYGKTIAVWQWLKQEADAKATISLDEYDNIPAHFCWSFCQTLQKLQPNNQTLNDLVSHAAFDGAPDEFTLRAITALNDKKGATLVVDDLHRITDERVLHLLLILLKRLPECFRIVMISRNDLPPDFSDLWINGTLARVTAEQLCFNSTEIALLYQKRGNTITQEEADKIYDITGGWAIGINALLLSGGLPSGQSLDYLESFIRSNVWEKWDNDTREFMLATSAAHELNPSLCAELSGVPDSEKMLRRLMRSGAFLSQTRDGIYHYHQLFRDFLRNMLAERGDGYLYDLLEKEGHWHLSRCDYFAAADCFIRCNNPEGLGETIDRLAITNRENFIIESLLPILLTPLFLAAAQKNPTLFTYMIWAALAMGNAQLMESYADQFYARLPEIIEKDPGRANNLFLLFFVDYRRSLSELRETAQTSPFKPSSNNLPCSVSMNMPFIHRCARDFSEIADEHMEMTITKMKDLIGWVFGDEVELLVECLKAGLYYERGQLEKAHIHALAANAEIRNHFVPELKFCAMNALISVLDALGQPDAADDIIKRLSAVIEKDRAYYLNHNFNAMTTQRKLENGDIRVADNWLIEHRTATDDSLSFYGIYTAFTTCRAYITCGEYDLAIILLKKIFELSKTYRRPLDMIESLILLPISYWKKKRSFQAIAMDYLEEAVSYAYGFGYTQLFVNEGSELSGMIQRLKGRVEQPDSKTTFPASFVKMLYLKTLEHHNSGLTSKQSEPPVQYTDKQKAVMKLICDGKSYREITESLGIKLPTLRSHIALIYKKLGVTNETDAVIKINALNLWESE